MWFSALLLLLALVCQSHCQTVVQQTCASNTQMTTIGQGANVIIGGLFEMRGTSMDGSVCGQPLSDTMQIFEAARFTINYLNNFNNGNGYISGVKFGMIAYDTCSSPSNALDKLQELYPQTTSSSLYCMTNNSILAGVVGTLSSKTTVPAAAFAAQLPVSIISPASTSPELSNKIKYPTFLRTVSSYVVYAKVVVELLKQLQWQNVILVYTNDLYGINGYEQLLMAMNANGLCVSQTLSLDAKGNKDTYKNALKTLGTMSTLAAVLMAPNSLAKIILQAVDEVSSLSDKQWIVSDIDVTNDFNSVKRVRGAMVVVPRTPIVNEFKTYFTQLLNSPFNNAGNPWFKEWFEFTYGCSQAANNCPTSFTDAQLVQSPWAVPTMKAVFAFAETIRANCQSGGTGFCSTLTSRDFNNALFRLNFNIPPNLSGLSGQNVKFDANGDPDTSEATVYNYNNRGGSTFIFQEIGYYVSNNLTLTQLPLLYDSSRNLPLTNSIIALCKDLGCDNCVISRSPITFRYMPGDLVVASLINAHEPGSTSFTCGMGKASQLASLVAAEWAVSRYKQLNPNQLQQVTLGSLVADVCPDSSVALGFLTDLLSGNDQLVDASGNIISKSNIQAFVDYTSSNQAKAISPIISAYNIPEVLTGVTTSMLFHGGNTPYLTRVVPSDTVLYSAISSLLQRLGWKYIQVATYISGEYREMSEAFKVVAAGYSICVVNTLGYFGDGKADPYNRTVTDLSNNRESQIVVVFGNMMDVRGLLDAIGKNGLSSQLQVISGTDSWSPNSAFIQGVETYATGAIIFDFEMSVNTEFTSYLQSLNLTYIGTHPFLRELFEIINECTIDSNSQSLYTRKCTTTDTFNNVPMGRVPYVVQSVYSVAGKVHEVISEICNTSYIGLCSGFYSASGLGNRLSTKLADITKSGGFGTKNGDSTTNVLFYVYNQGWKQFTQFNAESQTLASVDTVTLGSYQNKLSTCPGACDSCQYMFKLQTRIDSPGDWIIAGAFAVSNSGPEMLQPYICDDVRTTNGPQFTMAMMYALNQISTGKAPVSVKGVTFGGLVLDHCDNFDRAKLMVSDVYARFLNPMDMDSNKILAWITDTNESSNDTVPILDSLGVATVSPSATSDGLMEYPTFFRTIQGDAAVITALVKIVKSLRFSYMQVVYSTDAYGQERLNLLKTASQSERICITNQVRFMSNMSNNIVSQLLDTQADIVIVLLNEMDIDAFFSSAASNTAAKSRLMILLPRYYTKVVQKYAGQFSYPIIGLRVNNYNLSDYNTYINSSPISNPFFAQYYMKVMGCSVAGGYYSPNSPACSLPLSPITSNANYEEDEYVLSTIDAVYSIVDALHRTISDYCGAAYTRPCSSFLAAPDKRQRFNQNLNNINFIDDGKRSFRFFIREGTTTYNILQSQNNGQYNKVGTYSGQSMDLSSSVLQTYKSVNSVCTAPCLGCVLRFLDFSFTEGDVYIAGVFDVHERSSSPFTCGGIKTLHGYLLLEAFHYAIDQVNSKKGQFANILKGTRLGGIGLDSCESAVLGGYVISNIHSGGVTLVKQSNIISPSSIDAYIGTYTSTGSIYIARILTDLEIPQISYGAGSQDLSDTRVYPYFYRTVPTNMDEVEAMLKLMDKLNIRYVQVLYEDNSNGLSAMKRFVERAGNYSICVAITIPYPDIGNDNFDTSNGIVNKLTINPTANTIVTFLSTNYINSILRTIGSSDKARNKFRFVGSDLWGDNQDAILGAESQADGSVTIRLDADDVQNFESYINSKNLANSKNNPWFEEYFQKMLNCYISTADTKGYPILCPAGQANIINSPRYQQDADAVYVINAVYAAAFAIDKTLTDVCGANYATVCQTYSSLTNIPTRIRDNLKDVTFTDPVGKTFKFVNRAAEASYRFFSANRGIIGYSYSQIGLYNKSTDMISLYQSYKPDWNSDCNRTDACTECPSIRNAGIRYVFHRSYNYATKDQVPTIVAFFDIHKQGVDSYRCGDINVAGFQNFLAFYFTLETYFAKTGNNNNYRILSIDTCSNSLKVGQNIYRLLDGSGMCESDLNPISIRSVGSVITVGELNTISASRVLEPVSITYVSPNALTTWLDDKQHLIRTIAPISALMKTLTDLLSKLGWTYVDVVYEDSQDGVDRFRSFASDANDAKICRGSNIMIPAGSLDLDVVNLLSRLNGNTGSRAVILLGSYSFVKQVIITANNMSISDQYVWILAADWDMNPDMYNELVPNEVELRFIMVKRLMSTFDRFRDYMNDMTYSLFMSKYNNDPVLLEWFGEFYQTMFNCTLTSSTKPINIGKMMCDVNQPFRNASLTQDMYNLNTVAAIYAVMSGLNMCGDLCSLPAVNSTLNNYAARATILNSTLNVQWSDIKLMFDKKNRWWDVGYDIKHTRVKKINNVTVVKEDQLFNGTVLNATDQQTSNMKSILSIVSACKQNVKDACSCTYDEIDKPQPLITKPFTPSDPRNYYYYHSNGEQQYDWPIWAIVVAIFTSIGLLVSVILLIILVLSYPKKRDTSILGFMVIVGIIGIYAINFAFFVNANNATCGSRRFLMGVVYMIAIAPLFIKAIDNWRWDDSKSDKQLYRGITSPGVLLFSAIIIVLFQCIIPIIWLILLHPTATNFVTSVSGAIHDNWWCDTPEYYDTGLVQSFIFVMFVILITAIISALSFDNERNNFESRWILFGCIVTAGCFLVWMIVSTSAEPPFRDASVTLGNLVNATLLLIAFPVRKTILLWRHKNNDSFDDIKDKDGDYHDQDNSYDNAMFDLNDYDNNYGTKPSHT